MIAESFDDALHPLELTVKQSNGSAVATCRWLLVISGMSLHLVFSEASAAQIDITGPLGSSEFGKQVHLLANGNFVVADPGFDAPGGAADVGAVSLYRADGGLIYTLRGTSTGDQVGRFVAVLSNGNFVVTSPDWDNNGIFDAGAATWCSGVNGNHAVVSASNSLVGATASNRVGSGGAYALSSGHYVVISAEWDSNTVTDSGAVTWGNGDSGSAGVVGASNSLVGSNANDSVGNGGVVVLDSGHYVVSSVFWNNGGMADAGAVTWGNGGGSTVGTVGIGNSLVGSAANDLVGSGRVHALRNGHYVVGSPDWDNGSIVDAGAATWGNGNGGITGVINTGNSVVGSNANDMVSGVTGEDPGITVLSNGHYVVRSPFWDNVNIVDAGAATWGNGAGGSVGVLNIGNSLIGVTAGDEVSGSHLGGGGVVALRNGHYVVHHPLWDNGGIADAGAATWRVGTGVSGGAVTASNSLVGSSANDYVGLVHALSNGHYVVSSASWNNGGIADAGAVTWRDGTLGSGAVVSSGNSLVGNVASDRAGWSGIVALSNGHYVVSSPYWDSGATSDAGAVTWRNGAAGSGAVVSAGNSMRGSAANDRIGIGGVDALSNGHFVISSRHWQNGGAADAGAATWRNGNASSSGVISAGNSLVGAFVGDNVTDSGIYVNGVEAQSNGHYVVKSRNWDNGGIVNAGAISVGFGDGTTSGLITADNSVRGTIANSGSSMNYAYDGLRAQLIVGRPASNMVSLLRPGAVTAASITLDTPDASEPGQVVTFVTTVVASPAPSNGTVQIVADTGHICTDSSPTQTSPTTAEFSCQISFAMLGELSVRAEFLGTNTHGYSASGAEPHTVSYLFVDGFE